MTKVYEIECITLAEAYHLNQFYDIELTCKNGQVVLTKL